MIAIVALVIVAFMFIWIWRSGTFTGGGTLGQMLQQQPGGPTIFTLPGSPAAAAAPLVPGTTTPIQPPITSCNCTTNASCNAFCSSASMFNLCCFGTSTTPAAEEELPDPNPSLCSSQFNGSCNSECSNDSEEVCIECNAICDTDVAYSGDEPLEETATAGAAQPTCPAGYIYDVTHNLCVQSTAAPVYSTTPIAPPLTTGSANSSVCKNTYNGSCNTECSSGSQSVCNDCMVACGQATGGIASGGGTSGGRTAECSSRYNGSCNTECSGGSNSTCNACRAACGLSANIATVRSASQARHLLNNRLYNSVRANSYNTKHRRTGYERSSRASGNFFRMGNLI